MHICTTEQRWFTQSNESGVNYTATRVNRKVLLIMQTIVLIKKKKKITTISKLEKTHIHLIKIKGTTALEQT